MSWGTKGSDKEEALPSVKSSKGKGADAPVVEDTAKVQEDVDAAFKETVTRAVTKVQVVETPEKPTLDDQNKTFRTRLVSMWMLTNAGLAIAIENINGLQSTNSASAAVQQAQQQAKQNKYFEVILYSTFALAAVRFIGVGPPLWVLIIANASCSVCITSSRGIFSGSVARINTTGLFFIFCFVTIMTQILISWNHTLELRSPRCVIFKLFYTLLYYTPSHITRPKDYYVVDWNMP